VQTDNYDAVVIPPCTNCGGFVKPDVVFFGDSVPINRVKQCQTAVEHSDGLLVVGSSLAVHSAFKHVRAARQQGIPVCILNVGQTRAETEGLDVLKIEAPIGTTLSAVVSHFTSSEAREDSKGVPLN
jgi:NAD-dependent deacetylase sirtuin 4